MTTARVEPWTDLPAALAGETTTVALRRCALWGIVAATLVAGWGVQWDIQWHVRIGRDSFWIAPHVMTYAGVASVVLLSFGILGWDTWRRRGARVAADEITVMGITSTPGFHLAAWGIALTVLAAPIDDLWHRLFGIDVTLWSPPHLLGILGSLINTAACLLIAREVYPHGGLARTSALIVNAALLLGGFATTARPAFRLAYLHGGVSFHLYAILGALFFPLAYLTAARLSGLRIAPVLVLVVSLASSMIGAQIASIGFAVLRPVSVIEVEIAKDPDSPIAVAQAIARKNRQQPGARSLATQVASLIPVLVMVAVDPRRRPGISSVAYGVTFMAAMTWTLARSPAFAPMVPGAGVTLIALILTIVAAVGATFGARVLSFVLAGPPTVEK
jgi:hypothetical protein